MPYTSHKSKRPTDAQKRAIARQIFKAVATVMRKTHHVKKRKHKYPTLG